jgi:hypothetical protein
MVQGEYTPAKLRKIIFYDVLRTEESLLQPFLFGKVQRAWGSRISVTFAKVIRQPDAWLVGWLVGCSLLRS